MTANKNFILTTAALATAAVLATERALSSADDRHAPAIHALEIAPNLLVGGTPGDDTMRQLYRRGVRILVSVDGMQPDVELAKQHGLQYVHIPIGYDGVPREASLALARVALEAQAGVYVHCHHGKHRGPAAAAIVGRVLGEIEDDAAVRRLLTAAGTDRRFTSLWHDAITFRPPPAGTKLPELTPVAEVEPLAAAMAAADRVWQRMKSGGSEPRANALLLREAMRESIRAAQKQAQPTADKQMLVWLQQAEATVVSLEQAIGETAIHATRQALGNQCVRCHERYRD